jgi:elongation factor Ts
MAEISATLVKDLREKTGAGMMDCKKALVESGGDMEKAVVYLREKGLAKAAKKAGRATSEGFIGSYIHSNGKLAVLVELKCETDFVAKNEQFREFARELAMQICAAAPLCVSPDQLPADVLEREKSIYKKQAMDEGKPEQIAEKIMEGRLKKFYQESCLLDQAYIKDDKKRIQDLLNELIARLGENIQVGRFTRMALGDDASGE